MRCNTEKLLKYGCLLPHRLCDCNVFVRHGISVVDSIPLDVPTGVESGRGRNPTPSADHQLAEAIVATISRADAGFATKTDLAALEGRLTAAGTRLAFAVVAAHTAIVFGPLKLLLPS